MVVLQQIRVEAPFDMPDFDVLDFGVSEKMSITEFGPNEVDMGRKSNVLCLFLMVVLVMACVANSIVVRTRKLLKILRKKTGKKFFMILSAMLSEDDRSINICIVPLPMEWLNRK